MEITSPSPLGAHAHLAALQALRRLPDVNRIEPAPDADSPRADMRNEQDRGQSRDRLDSQPGAALPAVLDQDQPVGPPPSFQVNVLELARHLQQNLAKLEAQRAHRAESNPAPSTDADPTRRDAAKPQMQADAAPTNAPAKPAAPATQSGDLESV